LEWRLTHKQFFFFSFFFEKEEDEIGKKSTQGDEIAREYNTTIIITYLIVQEVERIARSLLSSSIKSEGKLFEITLGASSELRVVYLRV